MKKHNYDYNDDLYTCSTQFNFFKIVCIKLHSYT